MSLAGLAAAPAWALPAVPELGGSAEVCEQSLPCRIPPLCVCVRELQLGWAVLMVSPSSSTGGEQGGPGLQRGPGTPTGGFGLGRNCRLRFCLPDFLLGFVCCEFPARAAFEWLTLGIKADVCHGQP